MKPHHIIIAAIFSIITVIAAGTVWDAIGLPFGWPEFALNAVAGMIGAAISLRA